MGRTVQERRETLWTLLHETPEGLTREEIVKRTGVQSRTVKTDLKWLSQAGRVVLRQGGSVEGNPHSYRRVWFAVVPKNEATPLYDALLLSVENGVAVGLTAELLRKLRAELRADRFHPTLTRVVGVRNPP